MILLLPPPPESPACQQRLPYTSPKHIGCTEALRWKLRLSLLASYWHSDPRQRRFVPEADRVSLFPKDQP